MPTVDIGIRDDIAADAQVATRRSTPMMRTFTNTVANQLQHRLAVGTAALIQAVLMIVWPDVPHESGRMTALARGGDLKMHAPQNREAPLPLTIGKRFANRSRLSPQPSRSLSHLRRRESSSLRRRPSLRNQTPLEKVWLH